MPPCIYCHIHQVFVRSFSTVSVLVDLVGFFFQHNVVFVDRLRIASIWEAEDRMTRPQSPPQVLALYP